jgi:hypothetical protein
VVEIFAGGDCDRVEVALEGFGYVEGVVEDVVGDGGELGLLVDAQEAWGNHTYDVKEVLVITRHGGI